MAKSPAQFLATLARRATGNEIRLSHDISAPQRRLLPAWFALA